MRHQVGDVVDGRYRVEALLGEGGMSEVYRALDLATQLSVVLKLPNLVIAGDLAAFNRYRREMEIGTRLDHPGVQRLLSDGQTNYMVLEYIEGESLRAYLSQHAPLPIAQVVQIGVQLAETLQYVHQQGVVHRDLKPENILISPDGLVKLTDFGIALRLASRRLTLSHLSNAVGTPDYMAPEQVRGERGDARTDVYAMGVMLFELLTGEVPYPSDNHLDAMRRKAETEPPLVRRMRPDAPTALEAVVYRAMRRLPAERYPSMAALGHDLRHLECVEIPTSYVADIPPPKPLGDLPPWRTTLPILAAVLLVLLVLGLLAEFLHRQAASH